MMISLHLALSLFLVLRLSECGLVFHADCYNSGSMLHRDHLLNNTLTDHSAVRQLVEGKFGKARDRILALSQEMDPLRNVATANTVGNAGLQRSAAFLFDPDVEFYTVYNSLSAVYVSALNTLDTTLWERGLNSQDTVSHSKTCRMD